MATTRRFLVAAATATSVMAIAGVSYGYMTTHATGSGTSVDTASLATISATATVPAGSAFYPGAPAAPLQVIVDNRSNSYDLTITGVARDTSGTITETGAQGTCTNFAISVSTPNNFTPFTVAHGTQPTNTIAGAVTMTSADSGCQGATFSIPVTVTGHN